MKYYCVARGLKCGIYYTWEECRVNVLRYSNALYKKFDDLENALRYMELYCEEPYEIIESKQSNKISKYFSHSAEQFSS